MPTLDRDAYASMYGPTTGDRVRLVAPMLAIETVAAGGGSICDFDGIKPIVGPASAGADPGPACYGAGGPLTLTDVNLLLGRLAYERIENSDGTEGIAIAAQALTGEQLMLNMVAAEAEGREISIILQNAETIRLTRPGGEAVSIVSLQPGDEVLVALERGARHFGHQIQESITEK